MPIVEFLEDNKTNNNEKNAAESAEYYLKSLMKNVFNQCVRYNINSCSL